MTAALIESRWVDIPVRDIYRQLNTLRIHNWRPVQNILNQRYYLEGIRSGSIYGYPYSLPLDTIILLANDLNDKENADMTWYLGYNTRALEYYAEHNAPENEAAEYHTKVGNDALPKPTILRLVDDPNITLQVGSQYYALIGLYHLVGSENLGNRLLYVDFIDPEGNRLMGVEILFGWEGIQDHEKPHQVIKIDKGPGEPGSNLNMTWNMNVYGFYVPNFPVDRFKNIHTKYPFTPGLDEDGNFDGHHSHYVVYMLDTVTGTDPIPTIPPITGPKIIPSIPPKIINHSVVWESEGVTRETTITEVYKVVEVGDD